MTGDFQRIFFLIEYPFSQRDYERFGIKILEKNGFKVAVWNLTPLLHQKIYKKIKVPDPIEYEHYRSFCAHKDLIRALGQLRDSDFIVCLIGFNQDSLFVYRTISQREIPYCVLAINTLPLLPKTKWSVSLFERIKKVTFTKLVLKFVPFKFLGVVPPTVLVADGERAIAQHHYPLGKKTHILWAHCLDYDIFLREKDRPKNMDRKIGVFLDEYVPFHPEYLFMEASPFSSAEEYYPLLRKFFDWLEQNLGVRIIVAAHPRSRYETQKDFFGGRSVIRGKTAELVHQADFVIAHSSTSVNFAILFKKPVLFITTNKLQQSLQGPVIEKMASLLEKRPINLDNAANCNISQELAIDEKAYRSYRQSYIKKEGSDEIAFWQIFADYLKKSNVFQ